MKRIIWWLLIIGFCLTGVVFAESYKDCADRRWYILWAQWVENSSYAENKINEECGYLQNPITSITIISDSFDNQNVCRKYWSHSFLDEWYCKCDVWYYFYTWANGNRQCLLKDDTMMCGKNGLFIEKLSTCWCKDWYTRVKGECIDYNTDCRNNNGPKSYYITGSMTGEIWYRQYFCWCSSWSVLYADKCRESTKYIRGIVDNVTRTSFDLNYIWFDTKLYSATIWYNKTYCWLINIKNNTVVDIYIGMDNIVGTWDTLYDTWLKNSCNIDSMTWNIIWSKSVLKYISTPSSECLKNKWIWNRKKKTCTYKK